MALIRSLHLFFSLFLALSFTIKSEIIHYESDLSLILLKDGTQSFIDKSRSLPIKEYEKALNDIIALKNLNGTDVVKLFGAIRQDLNQIINRIESKFSIYNFSVGIVCILIGACLTKDAYYSYIQPYQENRNQYNCIKKYLKDNGVKIERIQNIIYFTVSSETDYLQERKQFVELENSANVIADLCHGTLSLSAIFWLSGIVGIFYAFNTKHEIKHLEKYKRMLTIITQLEKKISPKYLVRYT